MNRFKKTSFLFLGSQRLLTIIVLLFIFRTAIPFFKYPFIVLYSLILLYYLSNNFSEIKSCFKGFVKSYFWPSVLLGILFISFLFSNKIYLVILKDFLNALILLSIFYIFCIIIKSKEQLVVFLNDLISLLIVFALFISIDTLSGYSLFSVLNSKDVHIDNNFASIPVFFGIIAILYKLPTKEFVYQKIILKITLLLFMLTVLLSGSRRGFLLLSLISAFLFVLLILGFIKQKGILSKMGKEIRYLFSLFFLFIGLSYLFLSHSPEPFKNRVLFIFSNNIETAKNTIAYKLYKINSIFYKNESYKVFYEKIWPFYFDPKLPDSGWGRRIHKTVALSGTNVEIIPDGTLGYLMDSTCNASTWRGDAYSFTKVGNESVYKGDSVVASVYCFVSDDFNGTWVRLLAEGSTIGKNAASYNLKNKGEWQHLKIKTTCKKGKAPVYLYFAKYGVTDFSTLKGHVIFAYPQYKIIRKDNKLKQEENGTKDSTQTILFQRINFQKKQQTKFLKAEVYAKPFRFYNKCSMFSFTNISLNIKDSSIVDKDPIRNFLTKIIHEDTTYHPYKANIQIDTITDNFISPRTARWKFAWQLFIKEYNWKQKLFGAGFSYLNWYGYYFLKDKTKSDWPHNPFLSVLLYSGIIGLSLYFILLYKVFYYYIKYIKEYYLFFIFFLISFYFSFFSSISPFNPPVTGFFVMLPFLIHSHIKSK